MHSLTLKLSVAFLAVGLTGALLVAFFVGQRTATEFDRFLLDRNQQNIVAMFADYYAKENSWDGIDEQFGRPGAAQRNRLGARGADNRPLDPRPPDPRIRATLVATDGAVLFTSRPELLDTRVTRAEVEQGVPIYADGQFVGAVLFDGRQNPLPIDAPEGAFLARVNRAIIFGALGATVVALVLGVLLARTITRPVRELTDATQAVAGGKLGEQVPVHSRDELGELAVSFNQMSADLARATQLRRQMTADIAHDLRTPLSVILGYAEALSDGKLNGSPEMFTVIHQEANHLNHLIDDLRTLSLADAGELQLQPVAVAPAECLMRTANAHQVQAREHQVALSVEVVDGLSDLWVDPERIAQVLGNLVSNALRHTPPGGQIVLAATGDGGHDRVLLSVADTGPGIAPDDLPNIFERFYRGDASRTNNGASGLGLPIAKSIIEAHGGQIRVESRLGQGTKFWIALPASQPSATGSSQRAFNATQHPSQTAQPSAGA